jgi:group I intron endonuclease
MRIYLITNTINGKKYVGQTIHSIEKRWEGHCATAREAKTSCMLIVRAIKKYTPDNFQISMLEECTSREHMDEREAHWIKELNTLDPHGYNLTIGGGGVKLTPEANVARGLSLRGKQRTPEQRETLSKAHSHCKTPSASVEALKAKQNKPGQGPSRAALQLSYERFTYTMRNPEGETVVFRNLKDFCSTQQISYKMMVALACGERKSYRGWTLISRQQSRYLRPSRSN